MCIRDRYGMSPMKAIKSATINTAMLLGINDDLGSIDIGKTADIIAVKGNPILDIENIKNIRFVMKEGKKVDFNF